VEVEVHTTDGKREALRIDTVPGHPTKELSWDAIEAKFMDCASHGDIAAGRAAQAFAGLRKLDQCGEVGDIVELLTLP